MESLLATGLQTEYPALSERVQSAFIDVLFIALLMMISGSILDRYENPPDWIRIALFFGIWAVYEPLCTSPGGTIGNLIKGIRVRKVNDVHKHLNFFQALLRYVVKTLLGWLSFITIHTNPDRRAIHDLAAGSIMIKKR